MDSKAAGEGPVLSDRLGPPAQPLRYYCNKCGHMGEHGPRHDVCAGYPKQQCQYAAVTWGPFWSTEQVATAVAAEREHWMHCAALMLVARSGQITDMTLAERLVAMVDEQRPNASLSRQGGRDE